MKKYIAILVIFVVCVNVFSVSVFAVDDYQSTPSTWYDFVFHGLSDLSSNLFLKDVIPVNHLVDFVGMVFTDSVCLLSPDGYHHSDSIKGSPTGRDDFGLYATTVCKYCGFSFRYYSADLSSAYDSAVSSFDGSMVTFGYPYNSNNSFSSVLISSTGFDKYDLFLSANDIPYGASIDFYYSISSSGVYKFVFPFGPVISCSCGVYHRPSSTSAWNLQLLYSSDSGSTWNVLERSRLSSSSDSFSWDVSLYSGFIYRFSLSLSFSNVGYHSLSVSVPYFISSDVGLSRPASINQNYYNYNQTDSSTKYYIGKVDNSNNVTNVYNVNIFDETTNEFRDPYTDKPYQVTDWTYDYAQRIYYLTLADDSLLYNGTPVKHLAIWYANDAMYYIGLDDNFEVGEPYLDHVIFLDPFQYVIAEKKDDSGTGSDGHKHVFTSETTTPPTCTGTGVRTYSCQFCDYSYDEIIPAAGHQWEVTEVKDTEFNDNGDVTAAGYTLYTCAVCGETYKQWSNTGQPGPPTGNTGTGSGGGGSGGSSGSGTSFWDKLKDSVLGLLADLIDAVFGLIADVLSAVLGLVKDLLSFLFGFLSSTVIKGITDLFSAFGSLKLELPGPVTTVFAFFSGVILALPAEVKSLMIFGAGALFLIAIFKLVKA